jgi:hypothetical protein
VDDGFELDSQLLGSLPVINAFCDRLGLDALLRRFLPHEDARLKLAPATAVGVVVRNLVIHREPVYALGEWAAPFDPTLLGLAARRRRCSTTTGWVGCSRGCSTPTGPRC